MKRGKFVLIAVIVLAGLFSAGALLAAGKLAASVTPSVTRSAKKLQTPRPSACRTVDKLQSIAAMPNARRVPSRSMTGPAA